MTPLASLDHALASTATHAARFAARYPKTLAASVSLGLAGFAATAFGVAPMVADPAAMPHRLVVETVRPENLHGQLEALSAQSLQLFRSE
ncbi:MAG: M23 family peptidase, partial [Pseudomonadota bacterium]|nr:M23 family peptidase [Pseudomonadota bacterium]